MRAWRRRSSWRAARWGRRSPLSRGSPPTSRSTATSANGPRRPSLILGAADQVAGPAKPSSTADLAAKVWIAIDADGVAIAGEVTDDKVLFGTAQTMVNADHLELWLAFPAASLPLLGFANQFGETEVHGESDCNGEINHPDACKQWFAKQTRRRATLGRIFVRQYLLGGTGLSEAWASMLAGKHAADPVRACCAWSSGLVKKVPGGWRFEARIGLADLPASAQIPLKDVKLMVDLVDANVGSDKLETFRSSSPTRKFGEPDTFNLVTLAKPLAWESRRGPGDSRREVPRDVLLAWEACTLGVAVRECRGRVPVHARAAVTLDRSHPAWHAEDGGRVGDVGVIAGPSREGPELRRREALLDRGAPSRGVVDLPRRRADRPPGDRRRHTRWHGQPGAHAPHAGRHRRHVLSPGYRRLRRVPHPCNLRTHDRHIGKNHGSALRSSRRIGRGGRRSGRHGRVLRRDRLCREGPLPLRLSGRKTVGARTHEVPFKKSSRWDAAAKRYVEEK